MERIYLDHAATSPLVESAKKEMLYVMNEVHGNPSSTHKEGRKARKVLEDYRAKIAEMLGAQPSEVIFTSGATESNNIALNMGRDARLLTSAAEHKAVIEPATHRPIDTTFINPTSIGNIELESVKKSYVDHGMISFMMVNNETGSLTDIATIGTWAKSKGMLVHCDAVQALAHYNINFAELDIDLMSFSAHKIGGPKGIGVLLRKSGLEISPMSVGGGQEFGFRPGTENLIGVSGLAGALSDRHLNSSLTRFMRNELLSSLRSMLKHRLILNGGKGSDVASGHILNISLKNDLGNWMNGDTVILALEREGILVSSGSACTSGALEPSHVIQAMCNDRHRAAASIRLSFNHHLPKNKLDTIVSAILKASKVIGDS